MLYLEGGRAPAPAPQPPPDPAPQPPPRASGTTTQECFGRMRAPCGLIQNMRSQMSDDNGSGGGTVDLPQNMAPFVRFDDDRTRVKRQPPPWAFFGCVYSLLICHT